MSLRIADSKRCLALTDEDNEDGESEEEEEVKPSSYDIYVDIYKYIKNYCEESNMACEINQQGLLMTVTYVSKHSIPSAARC